MHSILPAGPERAPSLTGVAPEMIRTLSGGGTWLGPVRSAVLVVVDGLGAIPLRAHRAHARRLAQAMPRSHVARTVFPSTTAAALTSILTGAVPGIHGLVGYRVLDPDADRLVNQLSGFDSGLIDPHAWQRSATVFESAPGPRYAVGMSTYRATGLTAAILRGAEYVSEDDLAQRVRVAIALASAEPGAFVYCYVPELDQAGHRFGVDSPEWRASLEAIDQALAPLFAMPREVGAIVTADHGMVDVPRHRHVLLRAGDRRLAGVRHIGGEPRLLHLYAEPGADPADIARAWAEDSGPAADVSLGSAAVDAGLFGPVAPGVRGRIGDVLVAARGAWAFYDDRLEDKRPQRMIGQHGSTTPEEMTVPLIRAGGYAD
ncbi:alkaline phosphatase family protein [Microbacterium excoecariae]|uniref:alkaline phosphatase family protein n=1 Tax=Microbacterium excoecariae TaxID=2715210 RepID=UPI001408015D|nr:nucleotide pyrophosphatase/phosphodiesterase family protein [Microbacterium excoecariae]NHI17173.1 alkaline phosphatase family protein [Microbacterium excoecariae]